MQVVRANDYKYSLRVVLALGTSGMFEESDADEGNVYTIISSTEPSEPQSTTTITITFAKNGQDVKSGTFTQYDNFKTFATNDGGHYNVSHACKSNNRLYIFFKGNRHIVFTYDNTHCKRLYTLFQHVPVVDSVASMIQSRGSRPLLRFT